MLASGDRSLETSAPSWVHEHARPVLLLPREEAQEAKVSSV